RLTRGLTTRPGASQAARAEFAAGAGVAAPADYLDFMAASNGGFGQPGEGGLWVRLDPLEEVLPATRGQGAPAGLVLVGATALGGVRPGETVYDLGCGDGRIVITAARQFGARGVGVDLEFELIQVARALAVAAGVGHMTRFRLADIFTVDVAEADVVALYLLPE